MYSENQMQQVRLKKDLERAIRAGHPWIYRDALSATGAATGTVVDVVNRHGQFVARGLYDAKSPIAVRVATRVESEAVDDQFIAARLSSALGLRKRLLEDGKTNAFRWCSGEGDFLPGIVVDVYAGVAVLRIDGEAARAWRDQVVRQLVEQGRSLGITTVYERSRGEKGEVLAGEAPPASIEIVEHGVVFLVDVVHGQKTGFFLDQRENRRALQSHCKNAAVCNLFGYTGGFSVYAALAGAKKVVTVDSARPALEDAKSNFALNRLDSEKHQIVCADAFEWLSQTTDKFDVVIVDPPSFAPSHGALPKALHAYRDLNALALSVVAPGGLLAAASCSSHVTMASFQSMLGLACQKAKRSARVIEVRGQPSDHPTVPGFVEGRYLKWVLLAVD